MRSEPVLLVHGFASSFELNWVRNGWADLLADARREVIAVDLLGHGTAPKPHEPAAYANMEARVLEAIEPYEHSGPVDAVGFSLGGVTLLRCAALRPQCFARLVVAGVGERNMTPSDPEAVASAVETGLGAIDDDTRAESQMARAFTQFAANGSNDPAALAACLRRPGKPLSEAELSGVLADVLLVSGDRDFVLPLEPLAAGLVNAASVTVKLLRGIDHFGTPQAFSFLDAALGFLDALA